MNFFDELMKRWSAEKPEFFKKLQNIALIILVITGIPAAAAQIGIDISFIPVWLSTVLSLLSAGAAAISQFTVTSAEKIRLKLVD